MDIATIAPGRVMPQTGIGRRRKSTERIVIESVASFTLRISASREFVTATVAGNVEITESGHDIQVTVTELATGRKAKDARIYVPADIVVIAPAGLVQLDNETRAALGSNLTEQ